jgi:menaquinone-specific isochorismate synthase
MDVSRRAAGELADDASVAVRGTRIDPPSLASVIDLRDGPVFAWAHGPERLVGLGATLTLTADGQDRFETVQREGSALLDRLNDLEKLPSTAQPRLLGGFAFHDGAEGADPWSAFPQAGFILPEAQVTDIDGEWWLTTTATGQAAGSAAEDALAEWKARLQSLSAADTQSPPGIESRTLSPPDDAWRSQVMDALNRIEAGRLEKVVLAQSLRVSLASSLSIGAAFDRLGETYPDCFRFAFGPTATDTFFGATPELLVSVADGTVETTALAGSTGRGTTPDEDEWLAGQLRDSEKLAHEHALVVNEINEQLAPFTDAVETSDRSVHKLATIQHLRTEMQGTVDPGEHVLGIADALHPTPAVGGLPQDAALRTIRESETFDRGWYAAPIGWFDADGNGTFAVAIRSGLACGETVTLFAGNGIVADSDPAREYDEVQLKYRPILDVLE